MTFRPANYDPATRAGGSSGAAGVVLWRIAALLGAALLLLGGCEKREAGPDPDAKPAGASMAHYDAGDRAGPVRAITAAVPAPKPTGALPSGTTCVTPECHAGMATARQVHAPVASGDCSSCHEADTGSHHYPLKRSGLATCTYCHDLAGTQTHQHKALEQGCTACHKPHASDAKFLLKEASVDRLCASCHDVPLKKFAHAPFARGECTLCHTPHQSASAALLRSPEGPKHCFTCHDDLRVKINKASYVHRPAVENCGTCHSPHSTDNAMQLKRPVNNTCLSCHPKIAEQVRTSKVAHGAMLVDHGCANCHDAHASDEMGMLKARMDKTCLSCHDRPVTANDGHTIPNMKPVLTESRHLHGGIRAGNCSACHEAHGSNHNDLLARTFPAGFYAKFDVDNYALCFGCHSADLVLAKKTASLTNFRDGDTNLHFVHVNREDKGRTCKTCHNVHGSDVPKHIATDVPFEGSKWAMPIEFTEKKDGGRCAPGCHKARDYSHDRAATTAPVATESAAPTAAAGGKP